MKFDLLPGEKIRVETSEFILSNYRLIQDHSFLFAKSIISLTLKDVSSITFTTTGKTKYLKAGITGIILTYLAITSHYSVIPAIGMLIGFISVISIIIYFFTLKSVIRCDTPTAFIEIPTKGLKDIQTNSLFELLDSARMAIELVSA